jgi:hypothetical protein
MMTRINLCLNYSIIYQHTFQEMAVANLPHCMYVEWLPIYWSICVKIITPTNWVNVSVTQQQTTDCYKEC